MPPNDLLKLNVDGAIFFDLWKTGVCVIIQDHEGKTFFVASLKEDEVVNQETIKALSILRGLLLSTQQDISNIIVESDWQLVIKAILAQEESNSMIDSILPIIRELMSHFLCFKI